MVALKKPPVLHFENDWREAKSRGYDSPFAGFIFVCNNLTVPDLDRQLFGLPARHEESVKLIRKGMPLFLYNYSTRLLHGVFEAASNGGYNLDPYAWENTDLVKMGRSPVSRYPAQVKVRVRSLCLPLDEETFRPVLDHQEGHKFRLELSHFQVQHLFWLFGVLHSEAEWELRTESNITKLFQHTAFSQEPDSPNCVCKSDMDSCSVSSAGGNNYNEDEWSDESNCDITAARELKPNISNELVEGYLNHKTARLRLVQLPNNSESSSEKQLPKEVNTPYSAVLMTGMHTSVQENISTFNCAQVESKKNLRRHLSQIDRSDFLCFADENSIVHRLQDVGPTVNSDSVSYMQSRRRQALGPKGQDTVTQFLSFQPHVQPNFPGAEKSFYVPVPSLHDQQTGMPNVAVPQRTKWVEPVKLASGLAGQQLKNQSICQKKLNKMDIRPSQQPVQLANFQSEQAFVSLCMPKPASLHEQSYLATLISPTFLSSASAIALPSVGPGIDDSHEVCDSVTDLPSNRDDLRGLVQAGPWGLHIPVLLMPSFLPRMVGHPPLPALNTGALHYEILEFAKIARPTVDTCIHVEAAINCVRNGVRAVWPDADVEVFGSFGTGLCLRHSDVDLAIIGAPLPVSRTKLSVAQTSALLIRELSQVLINYYWCENITVIDTASMPVLKCSCRPVGSDPLMEFSSVSPVAIDITIGGMRNNLFKGNHIQTKVVSEAAVSKFGSKHTGGAAREYVLQKIIDMPALFPLVILLKSYLHQKGLSDVYSGGLGSFSLTLLLTFYLEWVDSFVDGTLMDVPVSPAISLSMARASELPEDFDSASSSSSSSRASSSTDCDIDGRGEFLVRRAANVVDKVLAMWNSSSSESLGTLLLGFLQTFGFELDLSAVKIVLRGSEGNGGIIHRDNSTRHIALWIDNPLCPGVNVGAGSYAMCRVQGAFHEMMQTLMNRQFFPLQPERMHKDIPDVGALYYLSTLFEADNC